MKKIEYDDLYVASHVYVKPISWNPPSTHEAPSVDFQVNVSIFKELLYSKINSEGKIEFYHYETGKKVTPLNYECSYSEYNINGKYDSVGIFESGYGYFVPFKEYMLNEYKKKITSITPEKANRLLKLKTLKRKLQGKCLYSQLSFNRGLEYNYLRELAGGEFVKENYEENIKKTR